MFPLRRLRNNLLVKALQSSPLRQKSLKFWTLVKGRCPSVSTVHFSQQMADAKRSVDALTVGLLPTQRELEYLLQTRLRDCKIGD